MVARVLAELKLAPHPCTLWSKQDASKKHMLPHGRGTKLTAEATTQPRPSLQGSSKLFYRAYRCMSQVFKRHMDLFWEPVFRSLQSSNPLCEAAAGSCITSLGRLVGPRILEGHLTELQCGILAARGLNAGLCVCSGMHTIEAFQCTHPCVAHLLSSRSLCQHHVKA